MRRIVKLENREEIYGIIKELDDVFYTPLSSRVFSLVDYSAKLSANSQFYAIKIKDSVVGYVAFYCNDICQHTAFLAQIAVKKEFQGKRIGAELLKIAQDVSKEAGCTVLRLQVDRRDERAVAFYIKNDYSFEELNSSFMRKDL